MPFFSGPGVKKQVSLLDSVYGINSQKMQLEKLGYDEIMITDDNFQTLLSNVGNGLVIFLWDHINYFMREFRAMDQKILGDQKSLSYYYFYL